MPLLTLISLSLLGMVLFSADSQEHATTSDKDVSCTLQVVGPDPLPYQGVRLRMTVRNSNSAWFGPVLALDLHPVDRNIKVDTGRSENVHGALLWGPFNAKFLKMHGATQHFVEQRANDLVTLVRDEQTSFSYAVSGRYLPAKGTFPSEPSFVHLIKTLFPEPGTYLLEAKVPADLLQPQENFDKRAYQTVQAKITVRAPQGDDLGFYDMLKRDDRLVSAMMWPVNVPEDDQLPKLRQLIEEYPKSSYTPYARFALARYHYARKTSKAEREKAIRLLRDLLEPERPYFPYEPYAIAALITLDPTSHEKYVPIMDREHPDAIEWLTESPYGDRRRIRHPRALPPKPPRPGETKPRLPELSWQDYRKRIPVDRWAKQAEKK